MCIRDREYVGDTLNISQPSTIFVGNRLFLIGGTIPNGTLLGSLNPNVYSSMIDETGKKGPWVGERPLPNGFLGAAVCLSRDRLVITGGLHNPAANSFKTYSAGFDPSGSLTNWIPFADLPVILEYHSMIAIGNRLFVGGGQTFDLVGSPTTTNKKIYTAQKMCIRDSNRILLL